MRDSLALICQGAETLSGPVAQVVEQLTFNQWVEGSNPSGLTIILYLRILFVDRSKQPFFEKSVINETSFEWTGVDKDRQNQHRCAN